MLAQTRAKLSGQNQVILAGSEDLTRSPFDWPAYLAWLAPPMLDAIFDGVGGEIQTFAFEFIEGVRDPNRGGQTRGDFVLRGPGGFARLHPGSSAEAAVITGGGSGPLDQRVAPEVSGASLPGAGPGAALPGTGPGASLPAVGPALFHGVALHLPWTLDHCAAVAQLDKVPRSVAAQLLANRRDPLDITNAEAFPWHRWVCNIGVHREAVVGPGVVRFTVERVPAFQTQCQPQQQQQQQQQQQRGRWQQHQQQRQQRQNWLQQQLQFWTLPCMFVAHRVDGALHALLPSMNKLLVVDVTGMVTF